MSSICSANATNVDVNRTRRHKMLLAPDLPKQLFARPGGSRMRQKEFEQLEFGRGQFDLFVILENAPSRMIQTKWPHGQRPLRRGIRVVTAQMRLDTGYQFTGAERLRNVIVASDLKTQDAIVIDFIRTSR